MDGLKLKLERFFISYNPDEYTDYQTLSDLIKRKAEFKRRFYLYNIDSIEYANLFQKVNEEWIDEFRTLMAKALSNQIYWVYLA